MSSQTRLRVALEKILGLPLLVCNVGHLVGSLAPAVKATFEFRVLSGLLHYLDHIVYHNVWVLAIVLRVASETLDDCILVLRIAGLNGCEACRGVLRVVILVEDRLEDRNPIATTLGSQTDIGFILQSSNKAFCEERMLSKGLVLHREICKHPFQGWCLKLATLIAHYCSWNS